jgi:hypothetical protein
MGEAKRRQAKASIVWAASDYAYHEAAHGVVSDKYGIEVINLAIANGHNDLGGLHARTSFVTPFSALQHEFESNPEKRPIAEWERLTACAVVNDLRSALAGAAIDLIRRPNAETRRALGRIAQVFRVIDEGRARGMDTPRLREYNRLKPVCDLYQQDFVNISRDLMRWKALKKGCDVDQLFNMAWVETTQDIRQSFAAIERVAIALDEKQTLTGAEFSALISFDLALAA